MSPMLVSPAAIIDRDEHRAQRIPRKSLEAREAAQFIQTQAEPDPRIDSPPGGKS